MAQESQTNVQWLAHNQYLTESERVLSLVLGFANEHQIDHFTLDEPEEIKSALKSIKGVIEDFIDYIFQKKKTQKVLSKF